MVTTSSRELGARSAEQLEGESESAAPDGAGFEPLTARKSFTLPPTLHGTATKWIPLLVFFQWTIRSHTGQILFEWCFWSLLSLWVVRAIAGRVHVTIGTDGLLLKRWGRPQWIPWSEVRELEAWGVFWDWARQDGSDAPPKGFDLVLNSSKRIALRTARERARAEKSSRLDPTKKLDAAGGDPVAACIRQAMATASRWQGDKPDVRLPSVGQRSPSEWVRELRSATQGSGDPFREASTDVEELWRAVEDPRMPQLERAAAAIAVGTPNIRATRRRLRAAAATVAHPGLDAVLQSAADGDDERLLEALQHPLAQEPVKTVGGTQSKRI